MTSSNRPHLNYAFKNENNFERQKIGVITMMILFGHTEEHNKHFVMNELISLAMPQHGLLHFTYIFIVYV